MVLDMFFRMKGVVNIYKDLGFKVILFYYNNLVLDVIYLGLDLWVLIIGE